MNKLNLNDNLKSSLRGISSMGDDVHLSTRIELRFRLVCFDMLTDISNEIEYE